MALNRINMVDAISERIDRQSQARTVTMRIGLIAGAASLGMVPVTIGGSTVSCAYLAQYTPAVNDRVVVFTQRDMFIVVGKLLT